MVGYAFAALFPRRVTKWVVMDAPLPGIGHWDKQLKNPKAWHFNFRGPDTERLVAGRERILLDRFYNDLSANPSRIDEQTRDHYAALYARPYAIHNAFSIQYAAFAQDAIDNQQLLAKGKLKMPVLAIGGDHSYGAHLATEIGFAAADVRAAIVNTHAAEFFECLRHDRRDRGVAFGPRVGFGRGEPDSPSACREYGTGCHETKCEVPSSGKPIHARGPPSKNLSLEPILVAQIRRSTI